MNNSLLSNGHTLEDLIGLGDEKLNNFEDKTNAPLRALRPSTVRTLSTLLNPIKILPSENGLLRDWRGLAELAGINSERIMFLESKEDPTLEMMKMWMKEEARSVEDLKAFLSLIDRFDVFDDVAPNLENDISFYWSQDEKVRNNMSSALNGTSESGVDKDVLTIGDMESKVPTRYDAFILYAEEDSEFAMQIVDRMENEYNLKICVKDRDLLGGSMFEHEIIGRIIEERCSRLLAIFSPNFLKSQANQFLVSYAQALALELRQRKIIPCLYIRCELPPSVRYSFCIDYNRSGKLWNFWDKLSQSIRTSPVPNGVPVPGRSGSKTMSASLPVSSHSHSPLVRDTSFDWWDAEKPRHKYSSCSDSGVQADVLEELDSMSLQSASPILSSSVDQKVKKNKWYKKLMSPSKKKTKSKELVQPLPM